ncbi:hypothetical protein GCM10010272_71190 [Streptomyces lateritius]|nr:hypothetical protein GCM10010272_71190 [Streptomyces lateritius]
MGDAPLDLSGYTISGPNTDKEFTFPSEAKLEASDRVRVSTNENHPETGGYSFASSPTTARSPPVTPTVLLRWTAGNGGASTSPPLPPTPRRSPCRS